jgi:hypothetical protein
MSSYELTREDIEKIALTGKACEDLAADISEIKEILKSDARNCARCKTDIDTKIQTVHGRINKIIKTHTGETAVRTWKDKTLGEVCVAIGAGLGIFSFVAWLVRGLFTGSWS